MRATSRLDRSYSGSEVVEQDIQRDLNQVFSQGSSGQSRSTLGSIDEDDLLNASCEAESKHVKPGSVASPIVPDATVPAVGISMTASFPPPPPPQGKSKDQSRTISASESPSKLSHHVRNLPTQNLFVPPLPRELEGIPYHILFICQRLAIDFAISMRDVVQGMDVPTVSSDPDAFWEFIANNPKTSQVKLRESSRVWQAAKRDFDVIRSREISRSTPDSKGHFYVSSYYQSMRTNPADYSECLVQIGFCISNRRSLTLQRRAY
jgi:hypothetical protein